MIPFWYRPIFIVSALLGLSLIANVFGLYWLGRNTGAAKKELQVEALQTQVAGFEQAAAVNKVLADRSDKQRYAILDELVAIADRAQNTKIVYRQAAAAAPLPTGCEPGQARMDAVNAGLGPKDVE